MNMENELESLRRENEKLRQEVQQLRKQGGGTNKTLTCLIIAAVGLVVGVVMLSILAAVALPMYSTFKQKGKVSTALKSISVVQHELVSYYDETGNFDGIEIAPKGGAFRNAGESIDVGLPEVLGMTWAARGEGGTLMIAFEWQTGSGCPPQYCNGIFTLSCDEAGNCTVGAQVGEDDPLGLSF